MEWLRCSVSKVVFIVFVFVTFLFMFFPWKEQNYVTHFASPFFVSTIKDNTDITSPSPPPLELLSNFKGTAANQSYHNSPVLGNAIKKFSTLEKIEEGLARARLSILESVLSRNYTASRTEFFVPKGSIYRNPHAFHQFI
ncbi:hypothetical protein VNO78_23447 [Psophocarpus tetragonolobus]|uniref:Uncharacterized protein n=1 Tax=Psophocarpus tetragonolobus TaxID=3891 RepID=A0AAN9S4H7_PSOTE